MYWSEESDLLVPANTSEDESDETSDGAGGHHSCNDEHHMNPTESHSKCSTPLPVLKTETTQSNLVTIYTYICTSTRVHNHVHVRLSLKYM